MPKSFGSLRSSGGIKTRSKENRATARERGYDARWDRLSLQVRQEVGVCEMCQFFGRVRAVKVADHKMPTADGGEMLDRANVWGLCGPCHSLKREAEAYARRTSQVDRLRFWCDNPDQFPKQFKPLV